MRTYGVLGTRTSQGRDRRRQYARFCDFWIQDVGPDTQNQQGPRAGANLPQRFSRAAAELAQGDIWLRDDIEVWINEHGDALADMLRTR
jgi:uncharacterized protein YfaQ (DUF2300 family)